MATAKATKIRVTKMNLADAAKRESNTPTEEQHAAILVVPRPDYVLMPSNGRCYRCHQTFPKRAIVSYDGGRAVIQMVPDERTQRIWSIANVPWQVTVCPACLR